MVETYQPNPIICPLCGQANFCAQTIEGGAQGDCWCIQTAIPAELLAQLPVAAKDISCVCQACVTAYTDAI